MASKEHNHQVLFLNRFYLLRTPLRHSRTTESYSIYAPQAQNLLQLELMNRTAKYALMQQYGRVDQSATTQASRHEKRAIQVLPRAMYEYVYFGFFLSSFIA